MNSTPPPLLSIVIPSFNEKGCIKKVINDYQKYATKYNFELIFVNNGSTDGTDQVLYSIQRNKKFNFLKIVTVNKNVGYGHGIIAGIKKSKGSLIVWTHADMQTPSSDVFKALRIYSRRKKKNIVVKGKRVGRSFLDNFISFTMGIISTIMLGVQLNEINAQPKLFPRSLLKSLYHPPQDFLLDLFLLYKAKKSNYKVISFNVNFLPRKHGASKWSHSFTSRVNMIRRTIQYVVFLSSSKK